MLKANDSKICPEPLEDLFSPIFYELSLLDESSLSGFGFLVDPNMLDSP